MKIYLAGPDVFLPDAVEIGRQKAAICAAHGLTGLCPLDNEIDLAVPDASRQIFCGNEAMMDAADAIIANLTPFRGAPAPIPAPSTSSATWPAAASSASPIPTTALPMPTASGASWM
ncbi:nucleoside 2-deoxyribosyltransferase [Bradyrhizobium sp. LM6.11]